MFAANAASALSEPGRICDAAAQRAAAATGVPVAVLQAITRTETGRGGNGAVQPWPWTVNVEGTGKWFDNRAAAQTYTRGHFDRGARSFDVGCFQINYRWHHQAFSGIDDMFDPDSNARYAAQFLRRLYAETGSWSAAAGAYHSRTPKYANRYRKRFERFLAEIQEAPLQAPLAPARPHPAPPEAPPVAQTNTYPLLLAAGQRGQLGSLVPLRARP